MKVDEIVGHLFLLFMMLGVLALPIAAGYQEARFKREQEVIKQWHIDNPDDKRLVFNCVSPEFTIDCSKPWLKKD